ncbi:MAG: hypothetical protein AAF517_23135 [Planctomycetota bacterium]
MQVPLMRRTVGENIGLCFSVAMGSIGRLLAISALFSLPSLVLGLVVANLQSGGAGDREALELAAMVGLFTLPLALVCGPIQQVASVLIVAESFTGQKRYLGECFSVALSRFFPVLILSMMWGLIITIGAFLLIIPGLIFLVWYSVSAVALVLEDLSATDSLSRSKELTAGRRWEVFALVLVFFGLSFVIGVGAATVSVLFVEQDSILSATIEWVVGLFVGCIFSVFPVVLYFDLRTDKDALDLDQVEDLVQRIGRQHDSPGESA